MFQPSHPPPLVRLVREEKKLISISVDNLLSSPRLCEAESPLGWERYVFCLNPAEFTDFEQLLRHDKCLKGYYVDKVQYDWEPPTKAGRKGRYILRMSSGVHERFVCEVSYAITLGIKQLADHVEQEGGGPGRKTAAELRQVCSTGCNAFACTSQCWRAAAAAKRQSRREEVPISPSLIPRSRISQPYWRRCRAVSSEDIYRI